MALYPNTSENNGSFYEGNIGKTHTNLIVSDGDAPHERMIVSKTNNAEPFIYEYGPEGNQTIVLAKGKIVEAVDVEYDKERNHYYTAVRQAEEDSERVLGVNHHNVSEHRRDRMEGNQPTLITRNLIEVPLFEAPDKELAAATAAAMHFGAAYGESDVFKPGDYVVTGKHGNFKIYDSTVNKPTQIVGQVWGASRELPPEGFLKYFTTLENKQIQDFLKQISYPASPGKDGYPYGAPYSNKDWKPEFEKEMFGIGKTDKGIPFLTDGYFSAQKRLSLTLDNTDDIETVVTGETATVAGKDVTVDVTEKETATVFVKIKHKIDQRKVDDVKVTYENASGDVVVVNRKDIQVDFIHNTVVVYMEESGVYKDLTIEIGAVVNPTAGIPTEWDYQGSVGALRILLQK